MKFFQIFMYISLGGLTVATCYLVFWLNWSDEMIPRLLSAFGVGVVTLMVAVLASLKGSQEVSKFSVVVLFDQVRQRFPMDLRPDLTEPVSIPLQRLLDRTLDLASASAVLKYDPQNTDDVFSYSAEYLQYSMLKELRDIQRLGTGVSQTLGASVVNIYPAKATVSLPDQIEVLPSQFIGYSSNRFFKTDRARFVWEEQGLGGLRVPRNTTIELPYITGPNKRIIKLVKRNYFELEITIEGVIGGAPGRLPAGVKLFPVFRKDDLAGLVTYVYDVTVKSQFEKWTSGNWRTEHYKRWAGWLMSELAARNRHDAPI